MYKYEYNKYSWDTKKKSLASPGETPMHFVLHLTFYKKMSSIFSATWRGFLFSCWLFNVKRSTDFDESEIVM